MIKQKRLDEIKSTLDKAAQAINDVRKADDFRDSLIDELHAIKLATDRMLDLLDNHLGDEVIKGEHGNDDEELATSLKAIMADEGMTNKQAADLIGCSHTAVNDFIRNIRKNRTHWLMNAVRKFVEDRQG